ncbi:hypothetical protein ACIOZM_29150, partial [Pseudomonas sp. NPDC087346]|uniref:hypothetical protein n=1 Tax=Pseudomonas sp. NPDC087346 TaxID=3364438 RepID=UPI0037F3F00E
GYDSNHSRINTQKGCRHSPPKNSRELYLIHGASVTFTCHPDCMQKRPDLSTEAFSRLKR